MGGVESVKLHVISILNPSLVPTSYWYAEVNESLFFLLLLFSLFLGSYIIIIIVIIIIIILRVFVICIKCRKTVNK